MFWYLYKVPSNCYSSSGHHHEIIASRVGTIMAQLGQIRQHPARLMKPLQQMQISKRWFCRSKDDATTSTGGTVKKLSMSSSSPTVGVDPNSSPQIIDINIGGRDFLVGSDQYFDFSKSFKRSESWRSKLVSTMLVYPNFISGEEELLILKEIEPYLSRLHYEESHWDDVCEYNIYFFI